MYLAHIYQFCIMYTPHLDQLLNLRQAGGRCGCADQEAGGERVADVVLTIGGVVNSDLRRLARGVKKLIGGFSRAIVRAKRVFGAG